MENKHLDKKTIVVAIFIVAAAAIMTYIGYNEVMAQSTANQTAAGTSNQTAGTANQSQAETLASLANLTGSDQTIMSKDKSISNSNNTLGNSLATNEFQSY
jgi:hypothetical protein